jgi:hypothetical protein
MKAVCECECGRMYKWTPSIAQEKCYFCTQDDLAREKEHEAKSERVVLEEGSNAFKTR